MSYLLSTPNFLFNSLLSPKLICTFQTTVVAFLFRTDNETLLKQNRERGSSLAQMLSTLGHYFLCGKIYYQERAFEIFELCITKQNRSRQPLHSMPSNWGRGKSASWRRVEIIKAFAFIRVRDSLPKIWPVTSPSSSPLHLAKALASNLTWVTAPW